MEQLNAALERFNASERKMKALSYAESVLFWDAATGAPKSGAEARGRSIGMLSAYGYEALVNEEMAADLKVLMAGRHELGEVDRVRVEQAQKSYDKLVKIPAQEHQAYSELISKASVVWEDAKAASDFSLFQPHLREIVDYLLKFAAYRGAEGHPYALYLDDYEEGMSLEQLNAFFDTLRARLVPLIERIQEKKQPVDRAFMERTFPRAGQIELAETLLDWMGFDLERGMLSESVHPFTMGLDVDDVRLTTHYEEAAFASSLYSVAHEGGHALYEQNIDPALRETILATGTSMGIHESQSRIFENNFCKSTAFLSFLYPELKTRFPEQLADVTFEHFERAINHVEPSLIRIDADELTYALHIMVRYEIELGLIDGSISVEALPEVWNAKMKAYLGVDVPDDAHGVLQDVHWSNGLFGYFPTYALGSAYAAQLEAHMRKTVDVDACLSRGDFKPLKEWLNVHIHTYGALKTPAALIEAATGEPLNANYYCEYLEKKFTRLYDL